MPSASSAVERFQLHFDQLLARQLDPGDRPVTALDLACGSGASTLSLLRRLPPGSRVVAVSEERADLRLFHERLRHEHRHQVFPRKERRDRLPFAANVFDVAWAALSQEPLRPARPAVRAALRVLRPGGLLLLAVPLRRTFTELVKAVGPALAGHERHPAFAGLMAEPADLSEADAWTADLARCGAIEVQVITETVDLTLTPPLSHDPIFTRHLLPAWLGSDAAAQASALSLLDATVKTPLSLAVQLGCVRGRRGMSDIEASVSQ